MIETVREKFTCRDCEKISQAPAPFHVIARGWAGPSLLAMIMFEKFGQHQPLNRQAERYALEGVPIALSTMADAVGSVCTALDPLLRLWKPMSWRPSAFMAMIRPCRCWPRARPTRGDAGSMSGTTGHLAEPDRRRRCSITRATARASIPQAHLAGYAGILQADAYDGYNQALSGWAHIPDRSGRRRAGSMHGARSSPWPILRRTPGARPPGKKEIPLSPHRDRGRAPDRRAVRDRAAHQWQKRGRTPGRPAGR